MRSPKTLIDMVQRFEDHIEHDYRNVTLNDPPTSYVEALAVVDALQWALGQVSEATLLEYLKDYSGEPEQAPDGTNAT